MTKEIYYSWDQIEGYCRRIVNLTQSRGGYKYIYGIPRGGLIPAVMISHIMDVPLILSFDELVNHNIKDVLIVDDIVDSGTTITKYIDSGYDVACLFYKRYTSQVEPDYFGTIVVKDDVWVMFPWETKSKDNVSKVNKGDCHGV